MLIWGQRLYGKCDRVPGEFYIATKFFHLWFIPLIPLGSWIVLQGSEEEDGWRGTPLDIIWKSVAFAYFRALMVAGAVGGAIFTFLSFHQGALAFAPPLLGAVVAAGLFIASKIFDKASKSDTLIFARHLGLSEEDAQAFANGQHDLVAPHGAGRHTSTGG